MSDIKRYEDFRLDQLSIAGVGLNTDLEGGYGEWFVAPCTSVKGGSLAMQANYMGSARLIKDFGYESFEYTVNNWQAGWVTMCLVKPAAGVEECLQEIFDCAFEYVTITEGTFYRLQSEAIDAYWESASLAQLVEDCANAGVGIFLARAREVPGELQEYYRQLEDFQ